MSGIYIPMEMPKGLGKTITIYPNGMVRVWVNNKGSGELLEQKAIPVPEHGALIDRDALPWENQGLMLTDPDEWGLKAWDIERAPTIIPASEVQK